MTETLQEVSDGVLEDIAYLARSKHRVQILDLLTGESYSRSEVEGRTGIARTTIDRIINEFEERSWAKRTTDGEYRATPIGEQVMAEFEPFVTSMGAIRKLGNLVAWLPTDDVPIELRHFRDATIRRPDPTDPTSTVSYLTALLREASEFHCIVGVAPQVAFEKLMRDRVVSGELTTEHVITDEEYHYLLEHRDRLSRWREYVAAGANLYRHDGTVPCNLFVFDDTVVIAHSQGEIGAPLVMVESLDEAVRSWALEVIREYKTNAEQLDVDSF
jgi:predicted transcriptional regulator